MENNKQTTPLPHWVPPPLYHRDKTGRTRLWRITDSSEHFVIEHGHVGGKLQSETHPIQKREWAVRQWAHKKHRQGYRETVESDAPHTGRDLAKIVRPMLASPLRTPSSLSALMKPCFVQPKMDGIRCMAYWDPVDHQVILLSRTGVRLEADALSTARRSLHCLLQEHPDIVLDGELYHPEIPFEVLSGCCRRLSSSSSRKRCPVPDLPNLSVQLHVFDLVVLSQRDAPFSERSRTLQSLVSYDITVVPTFVATTWQQFFDFHARFTQDGGYEGIIWRDPDGVYEMGYRSRSLQKYKTFQEEEFLIVGFTHGDGRETDAVIWICETARGQRFHVRPQGSLDHRQEALREASRSVGKQLTVRFQEYTKDGVPRFPVGKSVRIDATA